MLSSTAPPLPRLPSPAGRILVLDPLRGVAALAVMWFHFTSAEALLGGGAAPSKWISASGAKGWLGVEVLFVVSGFILPYAMWRGGYRLRDFWRFVGKRLIRLEPAYLCAVALALALWMAGSLVPGFAGDPFEIEWARIVLHVGYLVAFFDLSWYNPVFWTLAVEFQFYLLIALLYPLVLHRATAVRVAVPIALAALGLLDPGRGLVLHHLGLFSLGVVTAQYFIGFLSLRCYLGIFSIVAVLAYAVLGSYPAAVGVATALVIVALAGVRADEAAGRLLRCRPLVWLGSVSYSFYLIHVPVGGRVVNLGARFADGLAGRAVVLAVAVAASLLAAHLLHRFVERPSQMWSSSVRYKSSLKRHVPDADVRAAA